MIEPIPTWRFDGDRMRRIADAVLLEGYVLYPYRANAPKNRLRWSFGVLAPRAFSECTGLDRWWMETQLLVEGPADLQGALRFLRMRRRRVERRENGGWVPVERLEVGGALHLSWEEGELCEIPFAAPGGEATVPFALEAARDDEWLREGDRTVGRVRRETGRVEGTIRIRAVPLGGDLRRVEIRVENGGDCPATARREEALLHATLSTHLLVGVHGGAFVSLFDPPPHAAEAAATCRSTGLHPVLAGPPGDRQSALASPFILYDHPQVAPESPGDLCDATEIDELLSLRTATLTPEEKRIARATDPRAAAIVDRVERLAPGDWERLHGAWRDFDGPEMRPLDPPSGLGPGSRVRLRPGKRRTDAQDLLYAGMIATVHRIERDVSGVEYLAVTIDGDPAAELHEWYGRFHYYRADEVEPLEQEAP